MSKQEISAVRRLQIMWWALQIKRRWKGSDAAFDEAVFRSLLGSVKHKPQRFLEQARNRGQGIRLSMCGLSIEAVVDSAESLPGLAGTSAYFHSAIFMLGSPGAWHYDDILRGIDKILDRAGLARMSAQETFAEIETSIGATDHSAIEESLVEIAESWYLWGVEALRDHLRPFQWLELLVLLFREACVAAEFDRANVLLGKYRVRLLKIFDREFVALPPRAAKYVAALRHELFSSEVHLQGVKLQIEARRRFVGGVTLRPVEIAQRREVRALREKQPDDAWSLYEQYCDEWEPVRVGKC